jgi:hypothetical protein
MAIPVSDYNRAVQAWINEYWPPNNPCPMCHTASGWELASPADLMLRLDVIGVEPGRSVPVVPLNCARCGYVVLLSAIKMGVIPPDPQVPLRGVR